MAEWECRIRQDPKLALLPEDPGPPSWYPAFAGITGVYLPREDFDNIKKHLVGYPCEWCPNKIKKDCSTFLEEKRKKE